MFQFRRIGFFFAAVLGWAILCCCLDPRPRPEPRQRLILKDGSYQLAASTRFMAIVFATTAPSAASGKRFRIRSLTGRHQNTSRAGCTARPAREAVQLDKETGGRAKSLRGALTPVAPGLRLPEEGGVVFARYLPESAPTRRTTAVRRRAEPEHEVEHLRRRSIRWPAPARRSSFPEITPRSSPTPRCLRLRQPRRQPGRDRGYPVQARLGRARSAPSESKNRPRLRPPPSASRSFESRPRKATRGRAVKIAVTGK